MRSELAKEVLNGIERLSDEVKYSLSTGLKDHYGEQIRFSLDELSKMDKKDFPIIE